MPIGNSGNLANPLSHTQSKGFTNVINTSTGLLIGHSQNKSINNIFNIAMCPAPVRHTFFHQNSWSPIKHTFEVYKHTMLEVAWTIDSRQTKNRTGQFGMVHNNLFNQDFIVIIKRASGIIFSSGGCTTTRIEFCTKGRVLSYE